jgi:hypothetical protein
MSEGSGQLGTGSGHWGEGPGAGVKSQQDLVGSGWGAKLKRARFP